MTLLIVVIPLIKRVGLKVILSSLALILWISVLICRLYFHAHYLSDVVGGVTLGLTWIALWLMVYPLFERIKFKRTKMLNIDNFKMRIDIKTRFVVYTIIKTRGVIL